MNKIIIIFLLINLNSIYSQGNDYEDKIDTSAIIFKAKLFTLSKHVVKSKNDLIQDIDKLSFKYYDNDEYIFILIKNKYYWLDDRNMNSSMWCDCDYYICYSKKKKVYYLLGGFVKDDIDNFYNDFKNSLFYDWESKIENEFLIEFIKYVELNKLKKAKKCFKKCIETYN
ncbi:hypothetical protein [Flavobacterium sp.]|uniref:hypothetical protein n=1 Tax=Flavobacterium sp. TaxID=239 RepID=UPI003D2AF08B